ncbi:polyketide synthase dehydratase domain-containing protein [Bacillus velezensis]|nr:polyketide synthase dehydratase domain-containing protein [Bacillus velezensis]
MKKTVNLRLTAEHPIMKHHLVHGESVMPGLAYIDMLYQLAKQSLDLSFRSICLKRVTIYHPLSVKRSERLDVSVIFSKEKEFWTASICGGIPGRFSYQRRCMKGFSHQISALTRKRKNKLRFHQSPCIRFTKTREAADCRMTG